MSAIKPIRIFRAGTHTDMSGTTRTFSADDLQAVAAGYDPSVHEAPLVIGHPATDAPAWGWVERLSVAGGDLYAHPKQVDPQFAGMVNEGKFKHVSVSLYPQNAPSNPKPGAFYLRHVGFLGATPPAVRGLGEAKFRESGEEAITMEFQQQTQEPKNVTMTPEDLAKRAAELAAREAQFAEQQAAFQKERQAARAKELSEFAEGLVQEGRVLPVQKGRVIAILGALDGREVMSFAEGESSLQEPPVKIFQGFLKGLPVRVDFSERAKPEGEPPLISFAAPPGYQVDPEGLKKHRQILAYSQQHNVSYTAAIAALGV
ncbi:MAG: hypothetical protein HQM00_01855 [Magnetococcales bacterium]|nr:hypothetical protein [Magnetococcales bacterium]